MTKKKYFYNKNKYLWLVADLLVWILCIGITDGICYLFGKFHIVSILFVVAKWLPLISEVNGGGAMLALLLVPILCLGILLILTAIMTLPVLGIYYGISRAIKRNQKARVCYDVIADIDYFRDEFKDLSATDISLLMDLKLERGKDITATLLSLEQKKWIRIENDRIEPLSGTGEPLLFSEEELLHMIHTNQMHLLGHWENVCTQSAISSGLLTYNKSKKKLAIKMLCFIGAFIACSSIFGNVDEGNLERIDELLATYDEEYNEIDEATLSEEERNELLKEQLALPEIQQAMVLLVVMLLQVGCGIIMLLLPFAGIGYLISYLVSKPRYKRTRKGKILTEELAGMRNFIHDFSNLKEADKEQLVLWDNFLVYAVVLEENQNIVKEIGQIRNVDLSKFGRLG